MDVGLILSRVVQSIQEHLQMPVVLMEGTEEKPQYPYIGYKLLFHNANKKGRPIELEKLITNEDDSYDLQVSSIDESTMIIRFTACTASTLQAYAAIDKVINWFDGLGYNELTELGVVVAKVSKSRNKDLMLEENFERRVAIDVSLRVIKELNRTVPLIKQINFKRESEVID